MALVQFGIMAGFTWLEVAITSEAWKGLSRLFCLTSGGGPKYFIMLMKEYECYPGFKGLST